MNKLREWNNLTHRSPGKINKSIREKKLKQLEAEISSWFATWTNLKNVAITGQRSSGNTNRIKPVICQPDTTLVYYWDESQVQLIQSLYKILQIILVIILPVQLTFSFLEKNQQEFYPFIYINKGEEQCPTKQMKGA